MPKVQKSIRLQYSVFPRDRFEDRFASKAKEVVCFVCGNGLSEGHSITAKPSGNGNIMLCSNHFDLY